MKISSDKVAGAALAALGLAAFALSFDIGRVQWGGESARLFPQIVSVVLTVLSLRLVFSATSDETVKLPPLNETLQAAALFVIGVIYIVLIDAFGFLISTAIATPAVFFLFGLRSPLRLICSAIATPIALHIMFFELLGLFPPYGRLFDILDVLQGG